MLVDSSPLSAPALVTSAEEELILSHEPDVTASKSAPATNGGRPLPGVPTALSAAAEPQSSDPADAATAVPSDLPAAPAPVDAAINPAASDSAQSPASPTSPTWAAKRNPIWEKMREERARKERIKNTIPKGVNVTIPGIANAWEKFQQLDNDDSGLLELVRPPTHQNIRLFLLEEARSHMSSLRLLTMFWAAARPLAG